MESTVVAVLSALVLLAFHVPAASADESSIATGGFVGVEGRFFPDDAQFSTQSDDVQLSLVAEPEIRYSREGSPHQFKMIPFLRLDSEDDERSHVDLREAYWRYNFGDSLLLVGVNKVFWGVAESNHLVDIVNQSDNLEDIDLEDKLGQPMVLLGTEKDWGEVELFLMPYFRKREFPGEEGRLRPGLLVDDDEQYGSGAEEYHLDLALRYGNYIGDWDVGVSYFYGTSREPLLQPGPERKLIPFYGIIQQWGVDVQYTLDAWLWKFEGVVIDGLDEVYGAVVGGFEYTLYQIFSTNADLGLLAEYNWDGRDQELEPVSLFDNDIFLGARLALNNPQDTTALIGGIVDTENGSTLFNVEAQHRLGQSWVVEMIGRFFINIDEDDPTFFLEKDSFINLSLQYHF